jgi:agmatine deiminase
MAEQACARVVESALINEGDAFHAYGIGLLLATETVQLGMECSPHRTRVAVEREHNAKPGREQVTWINTGLRIFRDQRAY